MQGTTKVDRKSATRSPTPESSSKNPSEHLPRRTGKSKAGGESTASVAKASPERKGDSQGRSSTRRASAQQALFMGNGASSGTVSAPVLSSGLANIAGGIHGAVQDLGRWAGQAIGTASNLLGLRAASSNTNSDNEGIRERPTQSTSNKSAAPKQDARLAEVRKKSIDYVFNEGVGFDYGVTADRQKMMQWARDNLNSNTRTGEVIQAAKDVDEAVQGALMGMITKKVVSPKDVWLLYNDVHSRDIYDTMTSLLNNTFKRELSALQL